MNTQDMIKVDKTIAKVRNVLLSIDGNERVIGMHESYLISEALRYYIKNEKPSGRDGKECAVLLKLFQKLAW